MKSVNNARIISSWEQYENGSTYTYPHKLKKYAHKTPKQKLKMYEDSNTNKKHAISEINVL